MSFIGIVASREDYEFIEKELKKYKLASNIQLIHLNENSIENMKNIKFETIIISLDINEINLKNILFENFIADAKYLIINSDINSIFGSFESNNQIITYGMNQKSTVTTSSVNDDELLVCLQRSLKNAHGEVIEMQEFKMKIALKTNIYNMLVIFVINQLYK